MKVFLLMEKDGTILRAYAKKERADEDCELVKEGRVEEYELHGVRTREAKPRGTKREKVPSGV